MVLNLLLNEWNPIVRDQRVIDYCQIDVTKCRVFDTRQGNFKLRNLERADLLGVKVWLH